MEIKGLLEIPPAPKDRRHAIIKRMMIDRPIECIISLNNSKQLYSDII